jgi:hypothetical protein
MKSFKKIFNPVSENENNSTMEKRNLWKSPNTEYQVKEFINYCIIN